MLQETFWQRIFKRLLVVGVMFQTAIYVIILVLGAWLFYFTSEGSALAREITHELPLYLMGIVTIIKTEIPIGYVFLGLLIVFFLSLIVSWRGPEKDFRAVIVEDSKSIVQSLTNNFLFAFPVLVSMLLLADISVSALQESQGIPTGNISIPNPFDLLFHASYAAVFEEVGFRLIPFGTIVGGYLMLKGWGRFVQHTASKRIKLILFAVLYPEGAKKQLGLRRVTENGWLKGFSDVEWMVVLGSALMFASAHVLAGGGWGLGKFTTTFMGGIVLGLVYLVYGFQAAVLMHGFFNFHTSTLALASDFYGEAVTPLTTSFEVSILLFGVFGWIGFIHLLLGKKRKPSQLPNAFGTKRT